MNTTRQDRINTVNKIISAISVRGRNFFKYKDNTAYIFEKNGKLYMKNEYNGADMFLHTKLGYQPEKWIHGGTLWGLTKDFKDFIQKGGDTNHNNGYGGLYCPHWGYSDEDMREIQKIAIELGYLKSKPGVSHKQTK